MDLDLLGLGEVFHDSSRVALLLDVNCRLRLAVHPGFPVQNFQALFIGGPEHKVDVAFLVLEEWDADGHLNPILPSGVFRQNVVPVSDGGLCKLSEFFWQQFRVPCLDRLVDHGALDGSRVGRAILIWCVVGAHGVTTQPRRASF